MKYKELVTVILYGERSPIFVYFLEEQMSDNIVIYTIGEVDFWISFGFSISYSLQLMEK
jgi:hypothetical protein